MLKLQPKDSELKKSLEIVKELTCSVGQDYVSKDLFIGELMGVSSEIAHLVADELHVHSESLHSLTCSIKTFHQKSGITGASYLVNKLLKLKIRLTVEECELIDDVPAESEAVRL